MHLPYDLIGGIILPCGATGIPKPIPRIRPQLGAAAGMPLSPVREAYSPTSAAATQRQIEMRQMFSPGSRGALTQATTTGRGFEAVNGRAGRVLNHERGGRHAQRGGRRQAERAQRQDQPNGHSAPRGLLSAALNHHPQAMDGVVVSLAALAPSPRDTAPAEGGQARGSRSATDSESGFRGRGRGGRGRKGRELSPAASPELEMVSLTAVPPALASVASSDTASTISAPSGHASRTDTDTGRQQGRGEGGHGRSRCD